MEKTHSPSAPYLAGPARTSVQFDASEWIRLPRPGERCPVSCLSRSTLVELIKPCRRNGFRPPVKALHLKREGAAKGVVLINRASLREFFASLPTLAESYGTADKTAKA
jgi:hypothetical protein